MGNFLHLSNFLSRSSVGVSGHAFCINNNGGCLGLCLPSSQGRTCHCGDQETMDSDGVSCTVTEGHITAGNHCTAPLNVAVNF